MKYKFEGKPIKRCQDCIAFYIDDDVQECLLEKERNVWWAMEKPIDCKMHEVDESEGFGVEWF